MTERLQCESNSHQGGWSHVGGPLDLTFLLIILQRGKRKYRLVTKREAKKNREKHVTKSDKESAQDKAK